MKNIDVKVEENAIVWNASISTKVRMNKKGFKVYEITNYETISDKKLVRLFVNNEDEKAFDEIVNRYGNQVFGLALRITRNPNDAEDVLQRVYLTLIKKLDSFRGESKFSTWLYRVAVNESYMHIRRNKKHTNNISLEGHAPYNQNGVLNGIKNKDWTRKPDKAVQSKNTMEAIEKLIETLPNKYRVAIVLKDIEGLTNKEISEILEISVAAAKSRVHRGRLYLRDKLSNYFYE